VVEAADRPLAGALPAEVAEPMAAWYADAGAVLRTHARVERVEPGAVLLDDGSRVPAGAVVVGIGARPATAWLAGSGIELGAWGEVVADERLRTSAPDVHAVGDCASFPSGRYGERLLVHHWDNALQGPRTVARNIVGGASGEPPAVYDPVPYFWSEQFGRFVQYAGHHTAADTVLWRGDPSGPAWTACWLREGRLVALLAVGRPRDLAQARRLIGAGAVMEPRLLADPARPLKTATV
jgi:NADPH-dependent 2,4-dienoyl-CoA reductase/sulfur reductase-like enzyme